MVAWKPFCAIPRQYCYNLFYFRNRPKWRNGEQKNQENTQKKLNFFFVHTDGQNPGREGRKGKKRRLENKNGVQKKNVAIWEFLGVL